MSKYFNLSIITFTILTTGFISTALAQFGGDNPAINSVYTLIPEPPGVNCANGGNFVATGIDLNGNGVLNPNEVQFSGYACNGDVGAAGPPGPAGPQGSMGPEGPAGATGDQGPAGTKGPDGPVGAQGPKGPVGAEGPQGDQGPQGVEGDQGEEGDPGVAGADGLKCWDTNNNGTGDPAEDIDGNGEFNVLDCEGQEGPQGIEGIAGIPGPAGLEGPAGEAGAQGSTGPDGPDGEVGDQGPAGPSGANGINALVLASGSASSGDCPNGGTQYAYGDDLNNDGDISDLNESQGNFPICNGTPGSVGTSGIPGPSAAQQPNGTWTDFIFVDVEVGRTGRLIPTCPAGSVAITGSCGEPIHPGSENTEIQYMGVNPNNTREYLCLYDQASGIGNARIWAAAYCVE